MNHSELSTKDQLRETAMALFREKGYDEVSVMDICRACGVTKRTFYYHFRSKGDILSGIVDYWGIKAERLLSKVVAGTRSVDILWQLMQVYCEHSEQYGPYIMKQIYVQMLGGGNEVHFPYRMYLYDLAVQLTEKAQAAGEIVNDSPPADIVFILYHVFRSLSISWASENGPYNLTEAFRRSFNSIIRPVQA